MINQDEREHIEEALKAVKSFFVRPNDEANFHRQGDAIFHLNSVLKENNETVTSGTEVPLAEQILTGHA